MTMNSRNTPYSVGTSDLEIKRSRKPRTSKNNPERSEMSYQADENYSVSDTKHYNDDIGTKTQQVMFDPLSFDDIKVIESRFSSKSNELKAKIKQLQAQMASYSAANNSGILISTLINECLMCLSVEALSSHELVEYLDNDMGKLLYALNNILDEFERHLHKSAQTMHIAVGYLLAILGSNRVIDKEEERERAEPPCDSQDTHDNRCKLRRLSYVPNLLICVVSGAS